MCSKAGHIDGGAVEVDADGRNQGAMKLAAPMVRWRNREDTKTMVAAIMAEDTVGLEQRNSGSKGVRMAVNDSVKKMLAVIGVLRVDSSSGAWSCWRDKWW